MLDCVRKGLFPGAISRNLPTLCIMLPPLWGRHDAMLVVPVGRTTAGVKGKIRRGIIKWKLDVEKGVGRDSWFKNVQFLVSFCRVPEYGVVFHCTEQVITVLR